MRLPSFEKGFCIKIVLRKVDRCIMNKKDDIVDTEVDVRYYNLVHHFYW